MLVNSASSVLFASRIGLVLNALLDYCILFRIHVNLLSMSPWISLLIYLLLMMGMMLYLALLIDSRNFACLYLSEVIFLLMIVQMYSFHAGYASVVVLRRLYLIVILDLQASFGSA